MPEDKEKKPRPRKKKDPSPAAEVLEKTDELDAPEEEEDNTLNGVVYQEGKGDGGDSASHAGLFLSKEKEGQNWNPGKELFHASSDPTVYLPRTRIDESEIGVLTRITARANRLTMGHTSLPDVMAVKYVARIGQGGMARKELVKITTGGGAVYEDKGGKPMRAQDIYKQGMSR